MTSSKKFVRRAICLGPRKSQHCALDDGPWRLTVFIHADGYRYELSHRWSGRPPLVQEWPRGSPGFSALVTCWSAHVANFVRKNVVGASGEIPGERAVDEAMAADYPALYEYLTIDWLEGQVRETAVFGISVDAGQWKARLADRDNGLVCFVSADGFYAALQALERQLASGSADWRRDQYGAKAKKPAKRG